MELPLRRERKFPTLETEISNVGFRPTLSGALCKLGGDPIEFSFGCCLSHAEDAKRSCFNLLELAGSAPLTDQRHGKG